MNKPQQETRNPGTSALTRLSIAGLLLLVCLPILYQGCRGELDRWRAARAMESWLDGDRKQAIEKLQSISDRLPEDHRVKLVLGEWLLDDRQAERALKLAREIPEQYRDRRSEALVQHCLLALGKPQEALEEYCEANPANVSRSLDQAIFHKNSLAYFQALANQDLPLALQNSHFVVNEIANVWNYSQHIPLSAHLQGLFCSAMIYRYQMWRHESNEKRRDEYAEKAITILSGAIAHLEVEYSRLCQPDHVAAKNFLNGLFGKSAETNDEQKTRLDQQKEDAAHALATLLTVRALINQDLNQDQASFRDRRQVIKLGYQPEELADRMPSFSDCVFQLELAAMVLDTRGCVYYQLNNLPMALADLNIAVMAQEALVEVAEFTPRTSRETSLDPRQQFEQYVRGPQRTLAALLFHRSWARRGAGNEQAAASDVARIRQLGFVPGNYLF